MTREGVCGAEPGVGLEASHSAQGPRHPPGARACLPEERGSPPLRAAWPWERPPPALRLKCPRPALERGASRFCNSSLTIYFLGSVSNVTMFPVLPSLLTGPVEGGYDSGSVRLLPHFHTQSFPRGCPGNFGQGHSLLYRTLR